MSVIEKILKLMEEKQITARKLTTELDLANSSISEWKKGKAKPSLEAVVKIAKYFGVTTDYLLLDSVDDSTKIKTMTMVQQIVEGEGVPSIVDSCDEDKGFIEDRLQSCDDCSEIMNQKNLDTGNDRMNYNSYFKSRGGIYAYTELSNEEKRMLECYQTLDEEDKEYIRCKMIVLKRESLV